MNIYARLVILLATGLAASPLWAASINVSIGNASTCGLNYGGGFGTYQTWSVCQGSALFGWGVMYNDTTGVVSNSGASSTLEIDSGVLADTTARPARFEIEQRMRWNLTVEVQAAAGEAWHLRMDQSTAGLFAVLPEIAGDGNGYLEARYDNNQHLNVELSGVKYNVALNRTSLNSAGGATAEFQGSRSDLITGTGPATLSGFVRTVFSAYSACLSISPTCSNGPEVAILFGLDDIGDTLAVTADDYATWGRSAVGDGYNISFALVPVPSAFWLFFSGLAMLGAQGRRLSGRRDQGGCARRRFSTR